MQSSTLADRLNLLFHAFRRPRDERGERREWTNGQVARAAEHLYGRPVFLGETLRQARTGTMQRGPSAETIAAVARAFEFLSESEPEPGEASAIAAFLCIDPTDPTTTPDDRARQAVIDHQFRKVVDLRDEKFGRTGLMARLGDLQDPEGVQAVADLLTTLEEKERGRRGQQRANRDSA